MSIGNEPCTKSMFHFTVPLTVGAAKPPAHFFPISPLPGIRLAPVPSMRPTSTLDPWARTVLTLPSQSALGKKKKSKKASAVPKKKSLAQRKSAK